MINKIKYDIEKSKYQILLFKGQSYKVESYSIVSIFRLLDYSKYNLTINLK